MLISKEKKDLAETGLSGEKWCTTYRVTADGPIRQKVRDTRIRTKFSARAFFVSGPTLWNLLPAHLRVANNISSFRKLLKTHFFDLAFPP